MPKSNKFDVHRLVDHVYKGLGPFGYDNLNRAEIHEVVNRVVIEKQRPQSVVELIISGLSEVYQTT